MNSVKWVILLKLIIKPGAMGALRGGEGVEPGGHWDYNRNQLIVHTKDLEI